MFHIAQCDTFTDLLSQFFFLAFSPQKFRQTKALNGYTIKHELQIFEIRIFRANLRSSDLNKQFAINFKLQNHH